MNDPLTSLYRPSPVIDPDPAFAARLRRRLERLLLDTSGGTTMTDTETTQSEPAWPPALTPYIMVADARAAIDWYVTVLDGHRRGDPYVMDDGSIGHAEIGLGDSALMLAEGSPPDIPVGPPTGGLFSHTLHLQVPDVDRDQSAELAVDVVGDEDRVGLGHPRFWRDVGQGGRSLSGHRARAPGGHRRCPGAGRS